MIHHIGYTTIQRHSPMAFNVYWHPTINHSVSIAIQRPQKSFKFPLIWKTPQNRQNRSSNYHITTYIHRQNPQTILFLWFYLKLVGNHLHRCNNSSPHYVRENYYANPCAISRISYVLKSQDEHTASWFTEMSELSKGNSTAKLQKFLQYLAIQSLKSSTNKSNSLELNIIKHC